MDVWGHHISNILLNIIEYNFSCCRGSSPSQNPLRAGSLQFQVLEMIDLFNMSARTDLFNHAVLDGNSENMARV